MGYAGGLSTKPNYENLGDHTETVQIDYDPQRISYEELLTVFWKSHRPTQRAWRRQYMNAVFFHDDLQRQLAIASKAALEKETGSRIHTQVLPLRSFTRAEDYHQKYLLNRHSGLVRELRRIYPKMEDYVDSTAVARINGYVGGYGSKAQLMSELNSLGLTPGSEKILIQLVR